MAPSAAMVHPPGKPSSKARGKRPMPNGVGVTPNTPSVLTSNAGSPMADEETDEGSLAQSVGSIQTRPNKRVLPWRRRGGIGTTVGTSEIDVNILDMLKRKGENEPLIPTRTVFILTTDSSYVPPASSSGIGLNNVANERYFERPEVIKAYKAQRDIQVPEFHMMSEVVGGRLRARTTEAGPYEVSDEVYEKRHRKHELIEKRQRHREKEKLQHEHYKLKGRIDQLKTMDPNAFLVLASDAFGDSQGSTTAEAVDGAELSIGSSASLHEAERRRRLMLDVAISLEERYRTLLPPDRKTEARLTVPRTSASTEPSVLDEEMANNTSAPYQDVSSSVPRTRQSKSKLMPHPSPQPAPAMPPESSRRRKGTLRTTTPPLEYPQNEDSVSVMSSHSASSRSVKKAGRKLMDARKSDVLQLHSTFTPTNHTPHPLADDQDQFVSSNDLPSHGSMPSVNYYVPFDSVAKETPSRRAGLFVAAHATSDADADQSIISRQKPPRKKKQASRTSGPPGMLDHEMNHVVEAYDERTPDATLDVSEDVHMLQTEVESGYAMTASQSQPDHLSTECVEVEMGVIATSRLRDEEHREDMSHLAEDSRSILFAQLQQLERPDQYGELDITEQPEVDETPTADEPITPPVEHETDAKANSIVAQAHQTFLQPTTLEHISKRQKRHSTPFLHRRPSVSLTPELTEPATLSVVSMQSYEIQEFAGKGRRPKPLGSLLATSKHNAEPGRRTGRSVKAFGNEVPPWDTGKEIDFELPTRIIREVARRKVDSVSDAESDGDPPSFSDGMAHGEVQHDGFVESISVAGKTEDRI